jgi:GAF domain-containing protein
MLKKVAYSLLDADGLVTESLLARGATIREQRQRLVGEVLDKGLAGWVFRHRQVGLITDTVHDERWLTLHNQPYAVRSALGIPILKGKMLLGILTLMHSQPEHFGRNQRI